MADDNPSPAANGAPVRESKTLVRAVSVVACALLVAILYFLDKSNGSFLHLLEDTAVARGLITFLVAIITLCIALLIAVWVVASFAGPDDLKLRFSYLKDVLATLVGILGTILGFYFGSADKAIQQPLAVSDIQIRQGQVVAHVTGGTLPYRYSITPAAADARFPKMSQDGWIFEALPAAVVAGTSVTIEVTDAKDKRDVKTAKLTQLQLLPAAASATR